MIHMAMSEYIGKRILIRGKHPWAGETGEITSIETLPVCRKEGMRVALDNGMECFVFSTSEFMVIGKGRR